MQLTFQKTTTLPASHANTHEFLQPGCSYEIYVRDEMGNYAQQEFTVPGKISQTNKRKFGVY